MDVLLPVVVMPPGLRVNVHVPEGRPFNITEPVCTVQDGGVIVPIAGAAGAVGTAGAAGAAGAGRAAGRGLAGRTAAGLRGTGR